MNDLRGVTLIELLIVVAIIGILAAVAIPSYIGHQKRAARSEAYADLSALRLLQEQFFAENGEYAPLGGGNLNGAAAIRGQFPGFQPGSSGNFTYAIRTQAGVALPTPPSVPYNGATAGYLDAAGQPIPCFIAIATGAVRVEGDVFAVDCNNNRNF